jgi:hypothetical protein
MLQAALQSFRKLQQCVKREALFLDSSFVGVSGVGSLLVDTDAQAIMQNYLKRDKGIPAETSTEDYALFRAVSTSVSARDALAVELRVRCCIEMVKYEQYYRYQPHFQQLARLAPEYTESCIDCALMDEGSSVWTLSALASVIRRPIKSVYPSVNGPSDPAYQALNTKLEPREREVSSQLVRILWTSKDTAVIPGKWKPNHFVPLFDQQRQEPSSPDKASEMDASHDVDMEKDSYDPNSQEPEEEEEMSTQSMEVADGGSPIEYNRFMDIYEAFEKVTSATIVHSDIPRGLKENVWFLIDNSYNLQHPERRNVFYDDCGVWDSQKGSVAKTYLLLDDDNQGIKCSLRIRAGKFIQLRVKGRKKPKEAENEWIEMDPQPEPNRVVICHRYYAFLKRQKDYKRRIIWFTMPPPVKSGRDVAIVEYIGKFPGFSKTRHGNSRRGGRGKRSYVRTDPRLLEEIAKELECGTRLTPMKLFKRVQERLGPDCTLRDPRQIRNLKYSIRRKMKMTGQMKYEPDDFAQFHTDDMSLAEVTDTAFESQLSKGPIKLIIQQDDGNMTTIQNLPEGVELGSHTQYVQIQDGNTTRYLQLEEGQQTIRLVEADEADAGEAGDPNTQTIIMVKDFGSAAELPLVAGENEIVVTQAI